MTQAVHLSDRMPAVAHGLDSWSPEDQRHLSTCPECAHEWHLVQAGRGLGREVEAELDVEALATAITERLREPAPPRVLRFPRLRWMAVGAAAAAVLLAVLLRPTAPRDPGLTTAIAEALLPELEELSVEELEGLLPMIPATDVDPTVGEIPNLNDLTEDEVERVLRTLEG